jgi:hypothetical protein
MGPILKPWEFGYEPPFDGITKTSVRLAISTLREASQRCSEVKNYDPAARLDVVARALEETLEDDTIDWVAD